MGVLLMRWLRWHDVILTDEAHGGPAPDDLRVNGQVTRDDQGTRQRGWRGTDVPLHIEHAEARQKLASRHRICIVSTFYRKHFVSFTLPEELADGCCNAQGSRSCPEQLLAHWLGPPPNGGPLLRLTSGLD